MGILVILSGDVCILNDDNKENMIIYSCGDILGYEYMCNYNEYLNDAEAMTNVEYYLIDDQIIYMQIPIHVLQVF